MKEKREDEREERREERREKRIEERGERGEERGERREERGERGERRREEKRREKRREERREKRGGERRREKREERERPLSPHGTGSNAGCRCSAFDGIRSSVCRVHPLALAWCPSRIKSAHCSAVKLSNLQLVLAHLGMATKSPQQPEGQQNEQFPNSGLHQSVMTNHSIVKDLQSNSCRLNLPRIWNRQLCNTAKRLSQTSSKMTSSNTSLRESGSGAGSGANPRVRCSSCSCRTPCSHAWSTACT